VQLNHQERQDLAQFFDRRFPDGGARQKLARRAGLPCEDAGNGEVLPWGDLIELAAARGELARLATVARAAAPDDANLRSLAELMAPRRSPLVWLALPAVGLVVAAAVVLVTVLFRPSPEVTDLRAPDLVSVAGGGGASGLAASLAAEQAPEDASGGTPPVVDASAVAAPVSTPSAAAHKASTATKRAAVAGGASPGVGSGRCTAAQGELIGWWYAGSRTPAQVGTTYTLPTHANVRADYPDEHNRFNARSALRCTLFPGDRILMTHAAKQVPGNAFWVPLYGGDLLVEAP
jgi:Effector-associated domain 1